MIIKIGYMYIKDYKKLGIDFYLHLIILHLQVILKKAKKFTIIDLDIINAFSNLFCIGKEKFELIKGGDEK